MSNLQMIGTVGMVIGPALAFFGMRRNRSPWTAMSSIVCAIACVLTIVGLLLFAR